MSLGGKILCLMLGLCLTAELRAAGAGVCNGRPLPPDQSRKWRNHYLACTQDSSHFLRESTQLPEADRKTWANLAIRARAIKSEKSYRRDMQALGHKLPPIEWTGNINYDTIEHWDWTNWEFGPDRVACGTKTETTCYTDKDGKEHCTDHEIVLECWHDVDHHESQHCSSEILPYDSHFYRPTTAEWGPETGQTYYDELPNKYDLLPGESEDVQISNTSGWRSTEMTPSVVVGNAWNEYSFQMRPSSFACVYGGGNYHLSVTINTEGRVKKRSPNTFRTPVDRFGKEIDPKQWTVSHSMVHGLKFSDASAVVISSMARNSRSFGGESAIDKAEAEASRRAAGTSQDEVKEANEAGFDKDTHFRLRLIKIVPRLTPALREIRATENFYGRGAEFGKGARTEHYDVDLQTFYNVSAPWGEKFWQLFFTGNVEPGMSYEFRLSMYQKGVPFYYQEEDFTVGGENNWFSKELPIEFTIPVEAPDRRNGGQKLLNYYQTPWYKKTPDKFIKAWWGALTE